MNQKTSKSVLLAAIFSLLFAININAQEEANDRERPKEPPTFAQVLEKLDKNEDGKISKDEAKGPLKKHFKRLDLDEDGFISEEEFKKAPRPKRRKQDN